MTIDEAIRDIKSCIGCGIYDKTANMAIESLKFQQKYKAKVQKCIERIKDNEEYQKKGWGNPIEYYKYLAYEEAIKIIKEELGEK